MSGLASESLLTRSVNIKHVNPGESLSVAIGQLETTGGDIYVHGNPLKETRTVAGDGIRIHRAGGLCEIVCVDGNPCFNVTGDDFYLGNGIWLDADSTSAASSGGVLLRGKRAFIDHVKFHRFGNQTTPLEPFDTAPYAIKIKGVATPSPTASDWHHIIGPHIEFCHSGILNTSSANAMVSDVVARDIHTGGLWSLTGSTDGNEDGATMKVNGIWITHQDAGEYAVRLERLSGARRSGAVSIHHGAIEAGAGNAAFGIKVQSDSNELMFKSLIGGSVGFSWEDVGDGGAKDNVWHVTHRSGTGGVGPPVDQGLISDQLEFGRLSQNIPCPVGWATAATATEEVAIRARSEATVTAVRFIPKTAITANGTNFATVEVRNKGLSGSGTISVASQAFSGTSVSAYDERSVALSGTPSNLVLAEGDILTIRKTVNGSGMVIDGAIVIEYVSRDLG